MSRKLRQEQQYALQLKQEAEEEDDKIKQQQARIFGPITWFQLTSGFRVHDLKEKHYECVLEMIKTEYLTNEVLCRNSCIDEDEVSLHSLISHITYTLKDSSSIVMVDEKNDDALVGALLLRTSTKPEFGRVFSRTILTNGEARQKCLQIQTALNRKNDIFTLFNCDAFLRYYLVCIKTEYKHKDLEYHLMRAGLDVAKSLKLKVASGIFTDHHTQKIAKRLNFQLLQEVSYTKWRDTEDQLIFSDPGAGNYTCAIMAVVIPKERISDPNEVKIENPAGLIFPPPPRTRLEKRAVVNKTRSSFLDKAEISK